VGSIYYFIYFTLRYQILPKVQRKIFVGKYLPQLLSRGFKEMNFDYLKISLAFALRNQVKKYLLAAPSNYLEKIFGNITQNLTFAIPKTVS
jgi:hypothetical protein